MAESWTYVLFFVRVHWIDLITLTWNCSPVRRRFSGTSHQGGWRSMRGYTGHLTCPNHKPIQSLFQSLHPGRIVKGFWGNWCDKGMQAHHFWSSMSLPVHVCQWFSDALEQKFWLHPCRKAKASLLVPGVGSETALNRHFPEKWTKCVMTEIPCLPV